MPKRSKNKTMDIFKPSRKLEGFLLALFVLLAVFIINVSTIYADFAISVKTYKIKPIPFTYYEVASDVTKIPISFAKYGEQASIIYPPPKGSTVSDSASIAVKCQDALSQNIDKILKVQSENQSLKKYLTLENKISALNKDGFLSIVTAPQQKTFQRDLAVNKIIAEFRSKEFKIDKNTSFCIFVTFIYGPQKNVIEKIIISAATLESK